jgi:nucleotide-binding universal stress UspA family protein
MRGTKIAIAERREGMRKERLKMFRRVLLCHDGTDIGRRALTQGAELAISLGAEVHVLILAPVESLSPSVVAGSLGYMCLVNEDVNYQAMLSQSIDRLKAHGIDAHGHLSRGNAITQIAALSKSLDVDLIVVGQYPSAGGRRWWAGPERASLAESVNCAVLIAVASEKV